MLGVLEICNGEYQREEGIVKPEDLRIYVSMYIVHSAECFEGIREELKVLEGTLLEGRQEEGHSEYGQNAVNLDSF